MKPPDTIVAISTPPGEGGIGLVRLSGPEAVCIARALFVSRTPLGKRVRHIEYGVIFDRDGRKIDTGLAWLLKAPHSYTGEDTIEISCHGSQVILENLVQAAISHGAQLAQPGEFTRRAFLNGRLDLLQAEAVIDLIQASSRMSLENAYGHASGRLSLLVHQLKSYYVNALSMIEVGLDFSDEDLEDIGRPEILVEIKHAIELSRSLIETFEGSRRRQDGYLIALVGKPNVGKSTLLNALLGEERAIVTTIPGTTRDLVEGRSIWGGESVRLVDTAGIRVARDLVEQEGINRTQQIVKDADFVIAVLDTSSPWQAEDGEVLGLLEKRKGMVVLNKADLPRMLGLQARWNRFPTLDISGLTGHGLEELQQRIMKLVPRPMLVDGIGITRLRHHDLLLNVFERATAAYEMLQNQELDECVGAELQEGLSAIGELLGENLEDDVLDQVFSEFCIGK